MLGEECRSDDITLSTAERCILVRMCYYNTEQDAENTYGKLAEMAQKVKQEALVVGAEVSVLPAEGTPKPKQEASTAADIQVSHSSMRR